MFITKILSRIRQEGLGQYFSGDYSTVKLLQIRDSKLRKMNAPKLTEEKCIIKISSSASAQEKQKIKNIYKQIKSQTDNIKARIKTGVVQGDKFPDLGQFQKIKEEGTGGVSSRQGQALLVVVFNNINCGLLDKVSELTKTCDQKGKITIIAIGVYQEIQVLRKNIERFEELNIQLLNFRYSAKNSLISYFGQLQLPFYCLVDQNQEIRSISNSQLLLQENIQRVLSQKWAQIKEKDDNSDDLTEQEFNQFISVMDEKKFQENYSKLDYFSTKTTIRVNVKNKKLTSKVQMQVYFYQKHQPFYDQFKKNINKKIQVKIFHPLMREVPKVPDLCVECGNKLSYPLYWCNWSQNVADFRCRSCIQKKVPPKHYNYLNNSILLLNQTPIIPYKNIGQNYQPEQSELQNIQAHSYMCNGRKFSNSCLINQVGEARYVCLGCNRQPNHKNDYIDLCPNCIQKLIKKQKVLLDELKNQGHQDNHCWLRILYNVRSYHQF